MKTIKTMLKTAACAGAIVAMAGAFAPSAVAADAASFKAAYEAADAARKKAGSVGFEWRDTRKILKSAQKAAEKGDYAKAEKLAAKAKHQGEAAYAQAMQQEEGWKAAVVR